MTDLAPIVHANDVRGLVPAQFSPDIARAFGAAFVDLTGENLIVGRDMRESSPHLATAFIEGAMTRGGRVTDIGLCSTDGLYFASGARSLPAVMFTASHNPGQYNGMKLCRAGARPIGRDSGLPELAEAARAYLDRGIPSRGAGSVSTEDILTEYATHLRSLVQIPPRRRMKVVVDAGNGMAGLTAGAVLGNDLGLGDLGIDLVPMYFDLDGTFPNHEANPLEPANLLDLQATVIAEQADLGLAFDGDADRCFAVDNHGVAISPSAITALVGMREVAKENQRGRHAVIIRNLITSQAVDDLIEAAGGTVVRTKVGHAFIKEQMAAHDAVFGGEHSAHYYFRDFYYADSGMLAALHLLAALAETNVSAADLAQMYTPYVASGEINSTVVDVPAIMRRLREAFAVDVDQGHTLVDDTDGLTFSHWQGAPRWWFNVRPSNTEPLLRLNVEAEDEDVMEKIRDNVIAIIRQESTP